MFIAILNEIYIAVQEKHEQVGKYGISQVEMELWVEEFRSGVHMFTIHFILNIFL